MTYRERVPDALRLPLRLLAAVAAGLALWLSFPEHDLWWLAPVGVALLGGATLRAGGPQGFLLGFVAGLAVFVPTLSWTGIYVGRLPWFALAVLEALYVALQCSLTGFAGRRLAAAGATRAAYALIPLGWVAQEWLRGTQPWGGFPWARLAFSQADSPLAHLARWFGAPGVTFAVALVGTLLLVSVVFLVRGPRIVAPLPALLAAAVVLLSGTVPLPTDGRQATIGFVQGNVPEPGLSFNAERRAVLDNHVTGTERLAESAPEDLSLVVWPENASDIDPLRNEDAAEQVRRAQAAVDVPLVVGAVLAEPADASSNVSLFYTGQGEPADRYTKIHPVPFAEYIPHREFFRTFTPMADLAGNFVAGDEIGVFDVPAPGGSYAALPTICFEVAYDGLMRDSVLAAGDRDSVILVQTNNATFGFTAESEQQFAISRLRAIEHGRSVVHVSTVGVSGFVAPDGSVTGKTGLFTAEQGIGRPVLRSGTTLSDRLGPAPQALATAVLGLLVLASVRSGHRARVTGTPRPAEDRPRA
ncbi:apolipoprotein N-acyltransferase [Phycicoccus sp. BSK3Z-2]|uniref:Apolipoprotein N-acyltransferase n=1 Tax=Phycicoccus avicenniae TaxID=2828860 RepID=A0A941D576_9MICO|nr:apolipoprotein N-acyltransferase [Phycicoccus avicenniae]